MRPAGATAPGPPPMSGVLGRAARDLLVDAGIATASFVFFTGPIVVGVADGIGPTWAIATLGVLAAAPLAVRRRAPITVLVVVSAALVVAALSGVRFTLFVSNAGPALAVAAFTAAERMPRRTAAIAVATAITALTATEVAAIGWHPGVTQDAIQLVTAVPAAFLGYAVAVRRRYEEQLREREEQRAQEQERRIRAEERLRVSADVHDIVSSTLSMIAVRSGVARVVLEQQPDEARVALSTIESASRTALDELRAVLHALRDDVAAPSAPTLADLPALVAGVDADVTLSVPPRVSAPPLVEESAYRIVQEALTNVVKHAGPVPVRVSVTRDDGALSVRIVNTVGRPSSPSGDGFGLIGMRERVALLNGTFDAGPLVEGGFAVVASFPLGTHDD
ncbi:sensor histidine kinase [Cryptosporangium sp. NPDC048952]|uniref:sensor histidine kinase n=1 Tax=Cryptosporangium sp. NPDC048952 TaxID=3363961 RepID=UPI0037153A49